MMTYTKQSKSDDKTLYEIQIEGLLEGLLAVASRCWLLASDEPLKSDASETSEGMSLRYVLSVCLFEPDTIATLSLAQSFESLEETVWN